MRLATLGDTHAPFQDDRAIDLACHLLEAFQPDEVIHIGDAVDFYAVSSFDREPSRVLQLQQELDTAQAIFRKLKSAAPRAKWRYLKGNHEQRWLRYLARNPEIAGLRVLNIVSLLELDKLGIEYIDGKGFQSGQLEYDEGRLAIIHGERCSKHAGRGVQKELEDRLFQQSVVMGHTHKVGAYTAHGPRHDIGGWEIGCLCTLNPDWQANANWIQSVAFVTISETSHHFTVEQAVFSGRDKERRTIFRGSEFIAR